MWILYNPEIRPLIDGSGIIDRLYDTTQFPLVITHQLIDASRYHVPHGQW